MNRSFVKEIELPREIFGAPLRVDILHRVIHWQLACRRQGTHKVKGIDEKSGTGKKPFNQKGIVEVFRVFRVFRVVLADGVQVAVVLVRVRCVHRICAAV